MNTSSKGVTGLLAVICILLGLLLATSLWDIRQNMLEQQKILQQDQVRFIRLQMELQDDIILNLLDGYQETAYGSSVDRIAEQQLLAAETQLVALQTIALQNRQIVELLLLPYPDSSLEESGEVVDEE